MNKSNPTSMSTQGPTCAAHAERPAVTICAKCGDYACEDCFKVGLDRQDYCGRCGTRAPAPAPSAHRPSPRPAPRMAPTPAAPEGPTCAAHEQRAAVTLCSRCGNYACSACQRVGADGQDYCFRCKMNAGQTQADLGQRFGANLVDQLIAGIAFFMLSYQSKSHSPFAAFLALGFFLGVMGLQLYLLNTTGQSLGKRMVGIKVVRMDGGDVGLARLLLLRNGLPTLIGMFTCNIFSLVDSLSILGAERRCIHDRLADTQVVRVTESTD